MDNTILVENIPVELDMPAVSKKLGIKEGQTRFEKKLAELAAIVLEKARPRAIAKFCSLDIVDEGTVKLNGITVASTLLPEKFAGLGRVFPYLATEGLELAQWAETLESSLDMVFAGALRQAVCKQYVNLLEAKILETYGLSVVSCVQPGYTTSWPIEQQVELFQVLAPCQEQIGVTLLPSYLMYPAYSVSGIYYQSESKHSSCELCPSTNCPNRTAPYAGA